MKGHLTTGNHLFRLSRPLAVPNVTQGFAWIRGIKHTHTCVLARVHTLLLAHIHAHTHTCIYSHTYTLIHSITGAPPPAQQSVAIEKQSLVDEVGRVLVGCVGHEGGRTRTILSILLRQCVSMSNV